MRKRQCPDADFMFEYAKKLEESGFTDVRTIISNGKYYVEYRVMRERIENNTVLDYWEEKEFEVAKAILVAAETQSFSTNTTISFDPVRFAVDEAKKFIKLFKTARGAQE